MRTSKWRLLMGLLGALALLSMTAGAALAWPDKPITVYVGWSAGGSSDITSRAICLEMEKKLGQKILVTNVTGALGGIGASQVSKAPPDGYLWFGGAAVHGTWPILGHAKISWSDFYAFLTVFFPTTIYVKQDSPYKSFADYVKAIKAAPAGKVFKYGHPGAGSNGAIFGGLVAEAAGIAQKIQSIPYKGGREAGRFLLSGDVDFVSVTMGDLTDWAVAGRIRPLLNLYKEDMVFEKVKFPSVKHLYPDLVPFQAINPYFGVYLPRKTPADIVAKVSEAFAWGVKQPGFLKVAVDQRAGVLAPLIGKASDQEMSRIESARGWALYDLKIAKNDPAKLGVPKLKSWKWPPHERAQKATPWPAQCEKIYTEKLAK